MASSMTIGDGAGQLESLTEALGHEDGGLPDILDVLIVGAGPAGTAAAFRAKELGLTVLVVDRDEILSVLRDWMYPDDKIVQANHGPGGAAVPFPSGGPLVAELRMDEEELASSIYSRWARVYLDQHIPAQAGLELTGLSPAEDGTWEATLAGHERAGLTVRTRTVLLALGAGRPVQLDIPGDRDGIHYKLRGTQSFLGGACCVIGGGNSAAEAAIAIARAKKDAKDETPVYWSYHKAELPRLNPNLNARYFEAFTGGNLTYLKKSRALAVLSRDRGEGSLLLGCERVEQDRDAPRGVFYEFPKSRVLACIGAELPLEFLSSVGIRRLVFAETGEELMAVSPIYESALRGLFLAGNILHPAFIRTDDFRPETIQSTKFGHKGNFKQGMVDGVLVVEAIHKRLRENGTDDAIAAYLDGRRREFKSAHSARAASAHAADEPAAPAPAKTSSLPRYGAIFAVARFVSEDGRTREAEENERTLAPGTYTIGRTQGDILFTEDAAVADGHAQIIVETNACYVSSAGDRPTWIDVQSERTVPSGSLLAVGRQQLRFVQAGGDWRLERLDAQGRALNVLPVAPEERTYGRDQTNTVIGVEGQPHGSDRLISRRHFIASSKGGRASVRDCGSTNRTFLRVQGALLLNKGDYVIVGSTRFLFKGLETGEVEAAVAPAPAVQPKPEKAPDAPAPPKRAGAAVLTIQPLGEAVPIDSSKTLLQVFQERGWATNDRHKVGGKVQSLFHCEGGTCSQCIVEVLSGADCLSQPSGREKRNIPSQVEYLVEDLGMKLDPAQCRFACQTRIEKEGPVELRLLGDTVGG